MDNWRSFSDSSINEQSKIVTIKQLVYSIKNTARVYDIDILLWQHVLVYLAASSGQCAYLKIQPVCTMYYGITIFHTRCTQKQLRL
jgi:predicted transglutaminase-like protease